MIQKMIKNKIYMVLLVDRQKAKLFTIVNNVVTKQSSIFDDQVPKKVKHGDDTWDAQNKIFRHIEDHLHRHLNLVVDHAVQFANKNHASVIFIGSHKPLFSKIKKQLPNSLLKLVQGEFVTELKAPFPEIVKRALAQIEYVEQQQELKKLERSLM